MIKRPEGIDIAALQKKRTAYFDLMTPGTNTPWEERGERGMIPAFFKTAISSMFSPVKLTHQIRRPETLTDARGFVLGCSFFWACSWAIHSLLWYQHRVSQPNWMGDPKTYFLGVALKFVVGFFAPMILLKIFSGLFLKLVATEFSKTTPAVVMQNVLAYCFGPSLLAVVPFVGPGLALLWITVLFCIVGVKRLRLSKGGAIVGVLVSIVVTGALIAGIVFAVDTAFGFLTAGGGLDYLEPTHHAY